VKILKRKNKNKKGKKMKWARKLITLLPESSCQQPTSRLVRSKRKSLEKIKVLQKKAAPFYSNV
jgi:hypothetical protein